MRHSISINKDGFVLSSDHEYFKIGDSFTQNLKHDLAQDCIKCFKACLLKKIETGFEISANENLSGSVLYSFTYIDEGVISLVIDELSFNSLPSYKDNYFKAILDNSNDFIYKCDAYGYFTYVNNGHAFNFQ